MQWSFTRKACLSVYLSKLHILARTYGDVFLGCQEFTPLLKAVNFDLKNWTSWTEKVMT